MAVKTHVIEVDESTAAALRVRAEERGMTVSQLVAQFVECESAPLAVPSAEIDELDRRWRAVEARCATTSHDKVVRWLDTWGTPAFRPWSGR